MALRKIILEIEPNEFKKENHEPLFQYIHSFELLEMLKMDFNAAVSIALLEFHLKDGILIEQMTRFGNMEFLSVLQSRGNKHVVLVKFSEEEDEFRKIFRDYDLDLIFVPPISITRDKYIFSAIGTNENLREFIEVNKKHTGKILKQSFTRATYERQDMLSVLTEKQREVMIAAYKNGYYEFPKRINSEELSAKVKISKPTLLQHLRKAEQRLVRELMVGIDS